MRLGTEETDIKKMINRYPFIKMRKPYSSKARLYNAMGKSIAMLNMSEREGLSVITREGAAPVHRPYAVTCLAQCR